MELVFNCRRTSAVFKSDQYDIQDHQGVKTDANGQRYLDANVVLTTPCPHCGEKHRYRANELACPLLNN